MSKRLKWTNSWLNGFASPLGEIKKANFAEDFHENVKEAISKHPRVFELPFEADYRYMASFNRLTSTKTKLHLSFSKIMPSKSTLIL